MSPKIAPPVVTPTVQEARAVGIIGDRWPYGPNISHEARRALVDWAVPRRLRLSPRGRRLHWIVRGRCAVSFCWQDANRHPWMDHVTGWTRDGKPAVLVAQPYGLFTRCVADLAAVTEQWQLDIRVGGTGWYGYGTTSCSSVRPRAHEPRGEGGTRATHRGLR